MAKNLPRYLGSVDRVAFIYDLALYADDHISHQLGLDLEQLARDMARHDEICDRECRDWRRAAEELELEVFKRVKE